MTGKSRRIFLIGSNMLQLELMSTFIADNTGTNCAVFPCLDEIRHCVGSNSLVMIDCTTWNNDFKSVVESVPANNHEEKNFLVLINVQPGMGIESEALHHGICGFLYVKDDAATLLKMIHAVFNSELWVSRNIMNSYFHGKHANTHYNGISFGLTPREIKILKAISHGCSNSKIADDFCISPHTVKTHIYHIFKKINVSSRLQAAHWSAQNNIFQS
jgi:LuxR family transcriptional regulator of csgAB operon